MSEVEFFFSPEMCFDCLRDLRSEKERGKKKKEVPFVHVFKHLRWAGSVSS